MILKWTVHVKQNLKGRKNPESLPLTQSKINGGPNPKSMVEYSTQNLENKMKSIKAIQMKLITKNINTKRS